MRTLFINIKELIQVENLPKKFVAGKEMKMLPTLKNAFLLIENDLLKKSVKDLEKNNFISILILTK